MPETERRHRLAGIVGLGVRRVYARLTGVEPQRVLLAILGVALAIGLLVTVTGMSLGLASGSTVRSPSVDYWIVPEEGGATSATVATGGAKLGDSHTVASRLSADSRVRFATPVLLQVLTVENPSTGSREYVLAAGVVPPPEGMEIAGLQTAPLQVGDPHYTTGSYAGPWTGEAVISDATATFLNASNGTTLQIGQGADRREIQVVKASGSTAASGFGSIPVLVMHLSELQTITGGSGDDVADQILVSTSDPSVRPALTDAYPGTLVVSRGGLATQRLGSSGLPLAVAVAAFLTALGVGALFVATMMGLEVAADRRQLGVLAALGYGTRSRSLLVAVETVIVAALGGLAGVLLGIAGIFGLNVIAPRFFEVAGIAMLHPLVPLYGFGLAVLIGVLAAPYPILRSRRTDVLEVISRGPR